MLARTEPSDKGRGPHSQPPQSLYGRDAEFARARMHSALVGVLKLVFPFLGVVTAIGFSVYTYVSRVPELQYDVSESAYADGKLVMASPRLNGVTGDNRPYSMNALRAVQDMSKEGIVELEDVDASIPTDATNFATITSQSGVFDSRANTLDVVTPVKVETSNGMVARLQTAFVDIARGLLITAKPVEIEIDGATLRSDSMSVLENGKVMLFQKQVKMHIEPGRVQAIGQSGDKNAGN